MRIPIQSFCLALIMTTIATTATARMHPIDWKAIAVKESPSRFCSDGIADLFGGMGNKNGNPLELSYVATEEQTSFVPPPSASMRTTWKEWDEAVSVEIQKNLSQISERVAADDKLVVARVRFEISNNQKVRVLYVDNPTDLSDFSTLILKSIKQLENNPVLRFPKDKTVRKVFKTGRFSQNYGSKHLEKRDPAN